MKTKNLVVALLLSAGMMGAVFVPHAQAQEKYPSVKSLKPFTIPANFMSLPGCLRWQYFIQSGRWVSRNESVQAVRDQGASAQLDPTNWRYQARQAARESLAPSFAASKRGI